jgi:prepilin-type N-terminal cleavage/methylation domain-containing protein/prepilin-type processing-associated H-X9-DG protein
MSVGNRNIRRGFTLVELLVVIGIIALLISILLPALSKARQAANTVYCAANLHSIAQSMVMYSSQNNGWLPGSGNTSGAFLLDLTGSSNYSQNNCPDIISFFDWMSPIASTMGLAYDSGPTTADVVSRFNTFVTTKAFLCPGNQIVVVPYPSATGTQSPTSPMMSYATATMFLLQNFPSPVPIGASYYAGKTYPVANGSYYNTVAGYSPKLGSVRYAARKVFMADAGMWSDGKQTPDANIQYDAAYDSSCFSDVGPWDQFSRGWLRTMCPGNAQGLTMDARIYGFRHGKSVANGAADSFRFNVAFYDGHVQTMGDLEGSDPNMWMPTGSTVPSASEMQPDVVAKYSITFPFMAN